MSNTFIAKKWNQNQRKRCRGVVNLSFTTPFQKRLYLKVTQCVLLPLWLTFWCAQLRPVSWHPAHVRWRGLKGAWWTMLCFCGWIINKSNINTPGIKKKQFPLSILVSLLGFWEHLGSSRQSFCKGSPQKVPAPYPGDWCLSRSWKTQNTNDPWTQNLYKASNIPTAHQKLLEHQDLNILKPDWKVTPRNKPLNFLDELLNDGSKSLVQATYQAHTHTRGRAMEHCNDASGSTCAICPRIRNNPPSCTMNRWRELNQLNHWTPHSLVCICMHALVHFLFERLNWDLPHQILSKLWDITSLVGRKAALVHPSPVEFTGDTAERDRDDRSCWKPHMWAETMLMIILLLHTQYNTWYNLHVGLYRYIMVYIMVYI